MYLWVRREGGREGGRQGGRGDVCISVAQVFFSLSFVFVPLLVPFYLIK